MARTSSGTTVLANRSGSTVVLLLTVYGSNRQTFVLKAQFQTCVAFSHLLQNNAM